MKRYLFLLNPCKLFCVCCALVVYCAKKGKGYLRKAKYDPASVAGLGDVRIIGKNLSVGAHSYFNSGHITTDPEAGVFIGKWCAIGHNVTVLAISHDTGIPTGPENERPSRKGDVIIEDGVWIGSNVIVTPGVRIGAMSVIGGNAVVNKDIPPYSVCGGIPCRILFRKSDESIKTHSQLIQYQNKDL